MKMLLGILVFLLFADGVTGFKIALDDQKYLVTTVNKMRKSMAEKWRVGNMHELTWDEALVTKIKGLSIDCGKTKPGPDYRFLFVNPDSNMMQWVENELPPHTMQLLKDMEAKEYDKVSNVFIDNTLKLSDSLGIFELTNPTQTKIGCASQSCSMANAKYEGVCLLGPVNSLNDKNFVLDKAAGSACPTGTKAVDGLCRSSSSSQQFTTSYHKLEREGNGDGGETSEARAKASSSNGSGSDASSRNKEYEEELLRDSMGEEEETTMEWNGEPVGAEKSGAQGVKPPQHEQEPEQWKATIEERGKRENRRINQENVEKDAGAEVTAFAVGSSNGVNSGLICSENVHKSTWMIC
ncbi:unnamed protein product [Caenorhabditis sp. 36 PRJEB53466]|nr:unnamed protein product [Caenorhabditis sp. 36 PRJEB53466]